MGKHNHHTDNSLLVKFVRRGQRSIQIVETFPEIKGSFLKKEVVAICMNSPLYFAMNTKERKSLIDRLSI